MAGAEPLEREEFPNLFGAIDDSPIAEIEAQTTERLVNPFIVDVSEDSEPVAEPSENISVSEPYREPSCHSRLELSPEPWQEHLITLPSAYFMEPSEDGAAITSIVPCSPTAKSQNLFESSLVESVSILSSIDALASRPRPLSTCLKIKFGKRCCIYACICCSMMALLYEVRPPFATQTKVPSPTALNRPSLARFGLNDTEQIRENSTERIGDAWLMLMWASTAFSFAFLAALVAYKRVGLAKVVLLVLVLIWSLGSTYCAWLYAKNDGHILLASTTCPHCCLVYLLLNIFDETSFFIRLLFFCSADFLTIAAIMFRGGDYVYVSVFATLGFVSLSAFSLVFYRRCRIRRIAASLIGNDRQKYNAIWARLLEQQLPSIMALERASANIVKQLHHDVILQSSDDLVALLEQAKCLLPLLEAKALEWTREIHGVVQTAPLKDKPRALQKAMYYYDGNVRRLLDLCRTSIIFPSIEALAMALRVIAADQDVQIARLKNRFAFSYNEKISAGYRDVCLILKLREAMAERLALNEHYCELQLHVDAFLTARSLGSHRRYIEWKNLCCL